jgi:hypothetical protein
LNVGRELPSVEIPDGSRKYVIARRRTGSAHPPRSAAFMSGFCASAAFSWILRARIPDYGALYSVSRDIIRS